MVRLVEFTMLSNPGGWSPIHNCKQDSRGFVCPESWFLLAVHVISNCLLNDRVPEPKEEQAVTTFLWRKFFDSALNVGALEPGFIIVEQLMLKFEYPFSQGVSKDMIADGASRALPQLSLQ